MTLTRRERILIIFGLVLISAVVYVFYFLIPFFNGTGDAMRKISEAQAQIALLNSKVKMSGDLKSEIATLQEQLKGSDASMPEGIDHARILLYLKEVTDSRAADVSVAMPEEPALSGSFQTQAVNLDFRSDYTGFEKIVAALKENKLYNRVTFLNAEYTPAESQTGADTAGTPAQATPPDKNVLKVHIELCFYALQPAEGAAPAPPLEPSATQRTADLFPKK